MTAVMPPNTMAINYVEFAELKKKYTEDEAWKCITVIALSIIYSMRQRGTSSTAESVR